MKDSQKNALKQDVYIDTAGNAYFLRYHREKGREWWEYATSAADHNVFFRLTNEKASKLVHIARIESLPRKLSRMTALRDEYLAKT
jgi:hypothetical protein